MTSFFPSFSGLPPVWYAVTLVLSLLAYMLCCIMEASPPSRMRNVQKSARYVAFRLCRVDRLTGNEVHVTPREQHSSYPKLQALVYDILPSTTAVFSYAIGSRKLSANKQFFVLFSFFVFFFWGGGVLRQ